MAKTSIRLPTRMHRAWLSPVTIGTAVVVVVAIAAWALFVRSSDNPTRSVPAAASPSAASQEPRTDPIPVNPWDVSEAMLVVQGYVESLNHGDSVAALAAFSPDAAFTSPTCQPACVGTAAIAPVLEQTAATHGQLTLTAPRVEGDTLTAHFSVASPELLGGVQRIIGTTTAVVRNQEIVLLSMDWEATDPQTALVLNVLNQY